MPLCESHVREEIDNDGTDLKLLDIEFLVEGGGMR